jgi:2-polyprenyl-3-methyl-5-hydroxy-6-metoxy-1,4-benzoquinol methylase
MQYLTACPICQESRFIPYLSCQDHTVSHETFHLQQCTHCDFVLTNPRPDDKELSRYYQSEAYISHSNKSLTIVDHAYKLARRFTLKWKYKLVRKHTVNEPKFILDYGCGTGAFLAECKKQNMHVAGVEPSLTARSQADKELHAEIVADIRQITDKAFDAITLWHVLEHVTNLHETISALKDRLKENGTIFIAVPNLQSSDATEYREHWAGFDVPRHLWHFSQKTMKSNLELHDLKIVNVVPMRLDSYYVSLLSEKYKNGKTSIPNMAKALLQGWRSNRAAQTTAEYSSLIYIARK